MCSSFQLVQWPRAPTNLAITDKRVAVGKAFVWIGLFHHVGCKSTPSTAKTAPGMCKSAPLEASTRTGPVARKSHSLSRVPRWLTVMSTARLKSHRYRNQLTANKIERLAPCSLRTTERRWPVHHLHSRWPHRPTCESNFGAGELMAQIEMFMAFLCKGTQSSGISLSNNHEVDLIGEVDGRTIRH
jgi:hypothetical protein